MATQTRRQRTLPPPSERRRRRPSGIIVRHAIELFVPSEVLVRASPARLAHWNAQIRELQAQGWRVAERGDVARDGRVLTFIVPEDAA